MARRAPSTRFLPPDPPRPTTDCQHCPRDFLRTDESPNEMKYPAFVGSWCLCWCFRSYSVFLFNCGVLCTADEMRSFVCSVRSQVVKRALNHSKIHFSILQITTREKQFIITYHQNEVVFDRYYICYLPCWHHGAYITWFPRPRQ
jgi:hypothetical protein